jgi:hypothetical protein
MFVRLGSEVVKSESIFAVFVNEHAGKCCAWSLSVEGGMRTAIIEPEEIRDSNMPFGLKQCLIPSGNGERLYVRQENIVKLKTTVPYEVTFNLGNKIEVTRDISHGEMRAIADLIGVKV